MDEHESNTVVRVYPSPFPPIILVHNEAHTELSPFKFKSDLFSKNKIEQLDSSQWRRLMTFSPQYEHGKCQSLIPDIDLLII